MGKEQRKISPAVLEAYEEMERFFSEKGEKDLLQMMMYRYLSMVRRYASDAVKSGDEEEIRLGRYYDKKFRKDYRKYIWKIKKPKRKFRLWMYYHSKYVSDHGKTGKNFQVLLRISQIALKEDIWYYKD